MDVAILLAAVALDLIFAEPPLRLHPVRWFGKVAEIFEMVTAESALANLLLGAGCVAACVALAYALAALPLPQPFRALWQTYLMFSSISIKSMLDHARACLDSGMDATKVQMLVSRDAEKLSYPQRCSAVIESIAENFVDGVVAPLFYFSIFGVAGAAVYRAVNVCDAMLGYRTGRYEYLGKVAARLDDALNFIPARLSLVFFEIFRRGSFAYGLKRRVKLNGCSIAAMSYVLGVKLEKPGHYTLAGRDADVRDVIAAMKLFFRMSVLAVAFSAAAVVVKMVLIAECG